MIKPKYLDPLINVAAVLVVLSIAGYIAWEALHTEREQPCSARFPAATRFSLQSSAGKPLSAIELQARAGLRDLGVIDNARVVQVADGPSPDVLEVNLRKLPGSDDPSARARNGIEFRWTPPGMANATAACLSYSVWFPDKFEFGDGGFLPGISGGQAPGGRADAGVISVSPQWNLEGRPSLAAATGGDIRIMMTKQKFALPTSRWVKVEQEIALNDPGQENGRARLWVDGTPLIDDVGLPLRKDANTLLTGVLVAAGYQRVPAHPGVIRLSPFEISWR